MGEVVKRFLLFFAVSFSALRITWTGRPLCYVSLLGYTTRGHLTDNLHEDSVLIFFIYLS